ncbi:uncharacterized protein LOC143281715 [Babylonia areolata]|uniref:uncharacterized protein LOC143281715 n=1 Tax=Babylonia areolata TaxID=304850 RepID=UPI003FD3B8AD
MSLDAAIVNLVPTPRQKSSGMSAGKKPFDQLHDIRHTWTGPINTQAYDEKLAEMTNQSRNHLFWLARNKEYAAKSRHQTSGTVVSASAERPRSWGSWTNMSVMFTTPRGSALRQTDDMSSVMSTSSKVMSFCYLCSTMEEHQRNHLKLRITTPIDKEGSVREKRQRIRYIAPVPICAKRRTEEPAVVMVQEALYKVTVWTGDMPGASTDANVYIAMEGDQGALTKTQLWRRQGTSKFSFVRGSKEVFHIKGPKLGSLRTITIEHDGVEKRHGWFLERVEVQCMATRRVWAFPCKNWLSLHQGDTTLTRNLQAAVKESVVREFEVAVETGKKRFAGTDANVFLTLHGTEGSTRRLQLNSQQHPQGTCFQRGQTDRFKVQIPDIGEPRSLRIEHDGEGAASSWYLNKVVLRDVHQPQSVYHFVYNGWLAKDMGDGRLWRELRVVRLLPSGSVAAGKPVQYEVIVKTGDMHRAGTTANVYIALSGTAGKTGKMFLSDSSNNFERSKTESFKLKAVNVGKLKTIKIGLDTSGPDSGWFCDHVKVRKTLSRQEISDSLTQLKEAWKEAKRQAAVSAMDRGKENLTDSTAEEKSEERVEGEENAEKTEEEKNDEKTGEEKSEEKTEGEEAEGEKNERQSEGERNEEEEEGAETMPTASNRNAPEAPQRSARVERKTERSSVFDEKGRVLRVPVCEEYLFPCSKWFAASQQDDGLFERELHVEKTKLCYQER